MRSVPRASHQDTRPSLHLSSYVAIGSTCQKEADPQTIASGGVAFCAVSALTLVPLASAPAAIVTGTFDTTTVDVAAEGDNDFFIFVQGAGTDEDFRRVGGNLVHSQAYRATTDKTVGTRAGMRNPIGSAANIYVGAGGTRSDNFTAGTDNYVAVKFTETTVNGGNTVYGWAQINVKSNSEVSSVPEPSTLALMATGAAGVLALRRRRREGKRKA